MSAVLHCVVYGTHPEAYMAKLSNEERREVILKALQPGSNITQIARDYGLTRWAIYDYFKYVLDDPKQRMQRLRRLSGARCGS